MLQLVRRGNLGVPPYRLPTVAVQASGKGVRSTGSPRQMSRQNVPAPPGGPAMPCRVGPCSVSRSQVGASDFLRLPLRSVHLRPRRQTADD